VKKKWIISSGPDRYRPSVSSTEQWMRQFRNDGYSNLWINPIAFKSPFVNSTSRSSALRKIKDKIRTHLRWLRLEGGMWILVPLYVPSFNERADRVNRRLVELQVRICCMILGIRVSDSPLWVSGSFTAEGLLDWPFRKKVYEAADLISGFRDASPELRVRLQARERNLCDKSDVVFGASEKIVERL